jgi:hypothetical protein
MVIIFYKIIFSLTVKASSIFGTVNRFSNLNYSSLHTRLWESTTDGHRSLLYVTFLSKDAIENEQSSTVNFSHITSPIWCIKWRKEMLLRSSYNFCLEKKNMKISNGYTQSSLKEERKKQRRRSVPFRVKKLYADRNLPENLMNGRKN